MPCNTLHPIHDARRSSERGFTLTEVVIAAVLLVLVSGAFLQLVVGSTKAQTTARVQQRQQAVTESVFEKVRADTAWTDLCGTNKTMRGVRATLNAQTQVCTIDFTEKFQGSSFTKDPRGDLQFDVTVRATSVDSSADLSGADDRDGNTNDFFKIVTTVEPPDGYDLRALTSTSVIDPTSTSTAGVVDISFCNLPGQTDDRMVLTSCPIVPEANPGIAMSTDGVDRAGITAAEYGQVPLARRSVQVLPIADAPVSLVGVGKSDGTDYTNLRTGADGRLVTKAIKPGQYKIEFALPRELEDQELWVEQSIADLTINVQPFQMATGVVAYRTERAPDYAIRVERYKTDDNGNRTEVTLGIPRSVRIRLVPMPLGRAPIEEVNAEQGEYDGVAPITRVTFKAPRPGLYSPFVVNSNGGLERLEHYVNGTRSPLTHLWIAPGTENNSVNVPTGVLTPQPQATENSATYLTAEYKPPRIVPEVYTHDPIPEVPTCSYLTPNQLFETPVVFVGGLAIQPTANSALYSQIKVGIGPLSFAIWPGGVREGADAGGGRYFEIDDQRYHVPSTLDYFFFQPIKNNYRNCNSRCPGANIDIKHEAMATRVNIFCGPQSRCDQQITMDNGSDSFFTWAQDASSARGGVLNVYCLGDAACKQSATVRGDKNSNFFCYSGSNCEQRFPDPTGNWFGDALGGSVTAECYDSSRGNVCKQSTPLPAQTHAIVACYPESRCNQKIDDNMPWSSNGNLGMTIECHRAASCNQSLTPVLHLDMNGIANLIRLINSMFAGTKQGAMYMSCGVSASCAQSARVGKIDSGHLVRCYNEATCSQKLYNATTFDFSWSRSSMASQECLPKANCEQELVRMVASGSRNDKTSGLMQLCRTPPPVNKVVPVADNAMEAPCDLRNYGQRIWGPFHFVKNSRQHCETKSTCTQDLRMGGFGALAWFRADYYTQYCASTKDCTQTLDRPDDILSAITDANQLCEKSEEDCSQRMMIDDNTMGNRNGWRRQMCDAAGKCTQFMSSYSARNDPFSGNWFQNLFRGGNQAFASIFTSLLGKKNAVWQTCNVPVTEDPEGVVVVEEPSGDMDTSGGGSGGA